jgi:hypothetical protein
VHTNATAVFEHIQQQLCPLSIFTPAASSSSSSSSSKFAKPVRPGMRKALPLQPLPLPPSLNSKPNLIYMRQGLQQIYNLSLSEMWETKIEAAKMLYDFLSKSEEVLLDAEIQPLVVQCAKVLLNESSHDDARQTVVMTLTRLLCNHESEICKTTYRQLFFCESDVLSSLMTIVKTGVSEVNDYQTICMRRRALELIVAAHETLSNQPQNFLLISQDWMSDIASSIKDQQMQTLAQKLSPCFV